MFEVPFDPTKIRNFSIIAHIDHGKTTLTDRFLEVATGEAKTSRVGKKEARIMDSNPIEKERGITIKLAPVRLEYQGYVLNLIDTPGHVDFGYEVNRSLAAVEGALLIVDATQGVQAQTLSNYHKARELGLKIIPVINKIDLPVADVDKTILELIDAFDFKEEEILLVSAKTGEGVEAVLKRVIEVVPPPNEGKVDEPTRALVVTATFDRHKGAIAYIRVMSGTVRAHDELAFVYSQKTFNPLEVGVFTPTKKSTGELRAGEVGYVETALKDIRQLHIGDTLTRVTDLEKIEPLAGYKEPQPVVFMELYPVDADEFANLADAVLKLSYHDAALQFTNTYSAALGSGLRCGFLGILHAEIVLERLKEEYEIDLIATAPTVDYLIELKTGEKMHVHSPVNWPDESQIKKVMEPMARVEIFTPEKYSSEIIQFVRNRRGNLLESQFTASNIKLMFQLPLSELITNFHDELKALSSGFASLEYTIGEYQEIEAVKVNILLNGEAVEALSFIAPAERAESEGRAMTAKLKEVVPRQLFEIPVQAAIGGKVIARETIKAYRKDVTAKLYGGDVTRRQKLLKKQAKGKKRMKQFGRVELDQDVFLSLLKRN